MYHPTRGGVRGGRDQFTWESVKTDKDRECYLGHSLMAPVGRWQEGKDIMWYAKEEQKANKEKVVNTEFLKAKEMEEQALMAALGYRVVKKEKKEEIIKKESSDDEKMYKKPKQESAKGPQYFEFDDKKELDKMLLKLINKYGKEELFEALGGSNEKKKKKKDKRKSKKKSRSSSDSESESDESRSRKRKFSKETRSDKSKKQKDRRSRSRSSNYSSSSDSD